MDWSAIGSAIGNGVSGLANGLLGFFGSRETNETNKEIADENRGYQLERNEIEDARYAEETAYNRAFAENQREYERALQQEIFEREDTAIERQAEQLSKLGINPLSQNMSGLQAGQAVSSSSAPEMSSRGGVALHNDYKPENILNDITPIMSLAEGINGIMTGSNQRDLLRSQNDSQELDNQRKAIENLILANKNGIQVDEDGNLTIPDFEHKEQDFNKVEFKDKNATSERNERENAFQKEYKTHDNSPKEEQLVTALENQVENNNFITRGVGKAINLFNTIKHPVSYAYSLLATSAMNKLKKYDDSKKNSNQSNSWIQNYASSNMHGYK